MESLEIPIIPKGNNDASRRTRLAPGEKFQPLLMSQGNHGEAVKSRARIVKIVSGTYTPNGDAATLLVFEFQFQTPRANRRFTNAEIIVQFEDEENRKSGPRNHKLDPIVSKIVPCGDFALNKATETSSTTHTFKAEAEWGWEGLVGGTLGYSWELKKDITEEHYAFLSGTPSNQRKGGCGEDNAAVWWLEEDQETNQGIPRLIRTAVLLRRPYTRPFCVSLSVKTEVDMRTDMLTFWGIGRKEMIDPVTVDPGLRLNSDDGDDAVALGDMGKLDLVESTIKSLEDAIRDTQKAVSTMSLGDPTRGELFYNLGIMLRDRFNISQATEDWHGATQSFQDAVEATPSDHPDRLKRLSDLGMHRVETFRRTKGRRALDEAISTLQEVVEIISPGDSNQAAMFDNLGLMLAERGMLTREPSDLVQTILSFRQAVRATPTNDPERRSRLIRLGIHCEIIHRFSKNPQHLEEAISNCHAALDIMPSDDPVRVELIDELRKMLIEKYNATKAEEDLDMIIQNYRSAIKARHSGDPDRSEFLSVLGIWLSQRFQRRGAIEDVEEAIRSSREAVDTTPPDDPARPGRLSNLGLRLSQRYSSTGQTEDSDEAIRVIQEAIAAAPDKGGLYTNLGIMLRYRYHITQALDDIDQAIFNCRKAIDCVMLGDRYNRTESLGDLEEAIRKSQEAVKEASSKEILAICLNNLGIRLGEKYDKTGDLEDLEAAISNYRKAIQLTPSGHIDYAMWHNNLGKRLSEKYNETHAPDDLDEAIHSTQVAANRIPASSPDKAGILNNLGDMMLSKYGRVGLSEYLESAMESFTTAARMEHGLPMERIKASRSLGTLLINASRWPEAIEMFTSAFGVLQTLNPQSLPRADQQWVLSELSGLASNAASCALQGDRPASEALEFLEAGRSIIAGFTIDSQNDVADLRAKDAALCQEYEKYRKEISYCRSGPGLNANEESQLRMVALKQSLKNLANVEAKIRRIPGFERFQRPLNQEDMMQLAGHGPIVTFNVTRIRSDAIVVTSGRIWPIRLPGFTQDTLDEKVEFFSAAGTMTRRNAVLRPKKQSADTQKGQMERNLLWLWEAAVCPVLSELGGQQFQRIWWVAAGAIGRLPFHAAGDHSEGSLDNTISRVISSYTSTLKALRYARGKPKAEVSEIRMLLVDVPETPDHDKLETQHEVAIIKEVCENVTHLTHPGKNRTLENLRGCNFVHFACHGKSNSQDPSKAGLVLVEAGKPALLTIGELDGVTLGGAEIAYLSACSTAELPGGKLVDEAINLSNSFQLIGFRHVIGTMWGADDYVAGEVAKMFYEALLSRKPGEHHGEFRVAHALHDALLELRGRPNMREDVIQWGPFIHVGV
ncbi:hypothetical protein DL767_002997 [Monosporascus sp. MG133]|nr:hypothetical protein DL767_002997 [Monosporascus sp. MG133]